MSKQIILYALYPHSSHITQPCDIAIYKPLKVKWRQEVTDYKSEIDKPITKFTFPMIFEKAFNKITEESIKSGFRKSGLFPFNEDAIDYTKCISSRRKTIFPASELNSTNLNEMSLTYDDFTSVKRFFDYFVDAEKLEEFSKLKMNGEESTDLTYNLWKICDENIEKFNSKNEENSIPVLDISKIPVIDMADLEPSQEVVLKTDEIISLCDNVVDESIIIINVDAGLDLNNSTNNSDNSSHNSKYILLNFIKFGIEATCVLQKHKINLQKLMEGPRM